ncbi:MAG: protein kinase domain-containing protein [Acidimicrobiales bacterium]
MADIASGVAADKVLVGRYRLLRLIAQGGMAQVWEGHDAVLDRRVAVKVLRAHLAEDEAFLERFRREAVSAARLSHASIVATFDTGLDGGVAFIVMELVDGPTLRDVLSEGPAMAATAARRIAAEVADALDYAHRAGVVHRDVKPANILLCDDGRVKVADFGIAKAATAEHDLTAVGTLLGTAKYLAPEQVDGLAVDGRADVYALGVVLFEMLCGRPPFSADTELATALAHVRGTAPRPSELRADVPPALEAIVNRAMAREPADRYPTAGALRDALWAANIDGGDDTVFVARHHTPPVGIEVPRRGSRRRSRAASLTFLAVLLLGVGVAAGLFLRTSAGQRLLHGSGPSRGSGIGARQGKVIPISSTRAFDPPPGDGHERDDVLGNLTDGNPQTLWSTETYATSHFGNLKNGVGFVLVLDRVHNLGHLSLATPTRGWNLQVYVADAPRATLAEWGSPVATQDHVSGDVSLGLGRRRGGAVLVWITDLGSGNSSVAIGEASLTS